MILILCLKICVASLLVAYSYGFSVSNVTNHLRKLIGSNCILVERGTYPPFYDCIGCVIERAEACVEDLRYNKSGNVNANCKMYALGGKNDNSACCPIITQDLQFMGAAYPTAINCITNVGCSGSTIYKQLVKECNDLCTTPDPRSGSSACFAQFNAAPSKFSGMYLTIGITILSTIILSAWGQS